MKKILILFLAAGLITACNNPRPNDNRNTNDRNRIDDNRDNTRDNNRNDNRDNNNNRNGGNVDNTRNTNDGNNNYRWSQSEEDQFLTDCETTASKNVSTSQAKTYCSCMLGKMEKAYKDMDDANRNYTNEAHQSWIDDCNKLISTQDNQ